jgi:hypothetical protein
MIPRIGVVNRLLFMVFVRTSISDISSSRRLLLLSVHHITLSSRHVRRGMLVA